MVFSVISKTAPTYGTGKKVSEDQYEVVEGVPLYFYGRESIESEFGRYYKKDADPAFKNN